MRNLIIEYCRLNIEYLRSAFGGSIIEKNDKNERAKRHSQISNSDGFVKSPKITSFLNSDLIISISYGIKDREF